MTEALIFVANTQAEELKLMDNLDIITKVADVAGKEYSIEQALDKMQREWEGAEMQVLDYRETKTYVIKVRAASARIYLSKHTSKTALKTTRVLRFGQQLGLCIRTGCAAGAMCSQKVLWQPGITAARCWLGRMHKMATKHTPSVSASRSSALSPPPQSLCISASCLVQRCHCDTYTVTTALPTLPV